MNRNNHYCKTKLLNTLSFILIFCLFLGSKTIVNGETILGRISYWDDVEKASVGNWGKNTIHLETLKLNGDDSFDFLSAMKSVKKSWGNALDLTIVREEVHSTSANGDIFFFGGTKEEILLLTGTDLENIAGLTKKKSSKYGVWQYGNTTKIGRKITKARCFIASDYDDGGSRTVERLKNVAKHEMGHALGWVGHASKNNVMYKQESDVTILTKIDKRHLKQVY